MIDDLLRLPMSVTVTLVVSHVVSPASRVANPNFGGPSVMALVNLHTILSVLQTWLYRVTTYVMLLSTVPGTSYVLSNRRPGRQLPPAYRDAYDVMRASPSWSNTHAHQHGQDIANPMSHYRSMCTFVTPPLYDCAWLCVVTSPWPGDSSMTLESEAHSRQSHAMPPAS